VRDDAASVVAMIDDMGVRMKRTAKARTSRLEDAQVFTLEVTITSGPATESFMRKNPVVSRTIEIRDEQTLAHLHHAIFRAFDRDDDHMYEFQIGGRRPMDRKARRYGLRIDDPLDDRSGGDVTRTTIGSLGLKVGERFFYWFDFGDDWWHSINVLGIADGGTTGGKLPRVTKRVGESPPQYVAWDEEGDA